MEYEDKIKKFEENCYETSGKQAFELQKTLDDTIKKGIKNQIDEYKKDKEYKYNARVNKLEKKYNSEMFALEHEYKVSVLKKQAEILKKLKNDVFTKLREFARNR